MNRAEADAHKAWARYDSVCRLGGSQPERDFAFQAAMTCQRVVNAEAWAEQKARDKQNARILARTQIREAA